MKFLRVGKKGKEIVAAIDKQGRIRNLSKYISDLNPDTINFSNLEKIENLKLEDIEEINSVERIGSCVSRPGDFLAIGLNYHSHIKETKSNTPKEPILFNKSTGSLSGPNDPIHLPAEARKLDYEIEVGMVIGKKGKYIKEKHADEYIFGYCIVNDISERSWQKDRGGQWIKGKSIAGNCGPLLVTKNEIKDINNINLYLDVNGKRRQTGNTNKMIFNFNYLISYISQFMTLYPGTIITTGTPDGVVLGMKNPKFLKVGDKLNLKIDTLGEQNQIIVEEKII
jgi:2-keto-4-pentenoate hydratase/2-oxohepta-3-ene-1,7-dioic acid hydratase in catechol pathway|tara:strand:- start:1405 stop:2250 length:846 start_codon:yes stop_codon:yes gene_type:complete